MMIIFFVFSIISVTVAFFAYRILKAHALGQLAGGQAFIQNGNLNRGVNNADNDEEAPRHNYLPPPAAMRNQNQNNQY